MTTPTAANRLLQRFNKAAPSLPAAWSHLFSLLTSSERATMADLTFIRVPGGRAIVLPNDSSSAARSSLLDYRMGTGRKELLLTNMLAALAGRDGLAKGMVPDAQSAFAMSANRSVCSSLWDTFESTLQTELVTFSCVLRTPGPDWTPIVHLFDANGQRKAVAKIGFSDRARRSIRREANALTGHAGAKVSWLTSQCLGLIEEPELSAVLLSPLPADIASFERRIDADLLAEVAALPEVASDERHPDYLKEMCDQHGLNKNGRLDEIIFADIPRGRCHGDLVPWNMAHSGGRLVLWDWEYSFAQAPVGFDALQSRYRALREAGTRVEDALVIANDQAQSTLQELGLNAWERDMACAIHGIDAAARIAAGVDIPGTGMGSAARALSVIPELKTSALVYAA